MIARAGLLDEAAIDLVRPQEDLHRQHARRLGDALGRRGDEGAHADHQQRRGLAQRARHADDGAGQDAGQRQRQDMVEHDLHLRRADAQRGVADRRRHRLDRVAPGDDDHRHGHQRQRQPADQGRRARQMHEVEEHREPEQAEDDRRHRGKIVDRLPRSGRSSGSAARIPPDRRADSTPIGKASSIVTMMVRKLPLSAPQMPTADASVASDESRKVGVEARGAGLASALASRRSIAGSPSRLARDVGLATKPAATARRACVEQRRVLDQPLAERASRRPAEQVAARPGHNCATAACSSTPSSPARADRLGRFGALERGRIEHQVGARKIDRRA